MTHLTKLVGHCTWANRLWVGFVSGKAIGDYHLRALMSHILLGERAWFQRIRGEEVDREVWRVMPPDEMWRIQDSHATEYTGLLSGDLNRMVGYERFTGESSRASVSDILLHLCTHGSHHRGQMAKHCSNHAREAPNSDFIQFCMTIEE